MPLLIDTIPQNSTYKTSLIVPKTVVIDNQQVSFKKEEPSAKVKTAAITGSVITTLAYLFILAKNLKKGDFKFLDMFKMEFENMFKVMGLATSAVIGGLAGGLLVDKKENRKPKLKESIHQFLGNIVTPITIVGLLSNQINKSSLSPTKKVLLSGVAAIAGVCGGVIGGNYVARKVNNKIFNENDNRTLHIKDFGIHIDDLMTVATLSDTIRDKIKPVISWALPAIFLVCGYEAGTKNTDSDKK